MKRILVIIGVALLAGCASEVNQTSSMSALAPPAGTRVVAKDNIILSIVPASGDSDYQQGMGELRSAITTRINNAKHNARVSYSNDPVTSGDGTLVKVDVLSFKYVSAGGRFFGGILAGHAVLNVNVKITDIATGKVQADTVFDTESSNWNGIFGATTPRQIEAVADKIAELVTGQATTPPSAQ